MGRGSPTLLGLNAIYILIFLVAVLVVLMYFSAQGEEDHQPRRGRAHEDWDWQYSSNLRQLYIQGIDTEAASYFWGDNIWWEKFPDLHFTFPRVRVLVFVAELCMTSPHFSWILEIFGLALENRVSSSLYHCNYSALCNITFMCYIWDLWSNEFYRLNSLYL